MLTFALIRKKKHQWRIYKMGKEESKGSECSKALKFFGLATPIIVQLCESFLGKRSLKVSLVIYHISSKILFF
jgi:hypothetical protein